MTHTINDMSCCKQKRLDANKKDRMQTKKIGCKQKRSDAIKKLEPVTMQTKKIGCKQKRSDANKKEGCKQKRICELKRKWNNVERERADTRLAIFRVNEAN